MLAGDQRVGEGWTLVHEPVAHRLERGSRSGLPTVPIEDRHTKHALVCGAIQDATHVQRVLALDSVSLCLAHLDDILDCFDLGLHPHAMRRMWVVTRSVQGLVKTCSGPVTTEEKGDQPRLAVCYRPSADNPATGDTGLIEQRWTRVTRVSLLVVIGVVTQVVVTSFT